MEDVLQKHRDNLYPIGAYEMNPRRNLDGLLIFELTPNSSSCHAYTQLYRDGIIEAVESSILQESQHGKLLYPNWDGEGYEELLVNSLDKYLTLLKALKVDAPLIIFLTFVGIKGFRIQTTKSVNKYSIDRDIIKLPEHWLRTYDETAKDILSPMFDLIWNACGLKRPLD